MISERALKGQTDKLYFCTSLAPSNVIPSDSLALLLLQQHNNSLRSHLNVLTFFCSEGIGAVLVFIFVFAAFDPT